MIALLDSDIFIYRVGSVKTIESAAHARRKMDTFMCNMLSIDLPDIFQWEVYLTGKGNFRYNKAVTVPYKGNRVGTEKPEYYHELRQHLVDKWEAKVIDGMEADDMLAIRQEALEESMIVTLDKDLDQITGWHYNFVKKERYFIDEKTALLNFYMQFLTGDTVDNIVGVKGIGKVKARKLLEGKSESEMWSIVIEHLGLERSIENGHLLFMLRHETDSFTDYLNRRGLKHG